MTTLERVDVLVVGGGINGVGVARDAAGRGLKVALIEQADLAAATSSASTKLIHGGLRYLEFFEFGLVRESLIERERLLRIAPHLIRPMQFVLPHVPGLRPRWQIRLGLLFYDHVGARRTLPASRALRLSGAEHRELRAELEHAFSYSDCTVDDSRLVICNALDAAERGASIRTRTRLISAEVREGLWHVRCEDSARGSCELQARAIVNAAGPWVEQIERCLPIAPGRAQLRLVKGSHIVVPQLYEGQHAYMLQNTDGRIVFTIPFERHWTLIGTTEVPFESDPAQVRISPEELEYLCATVNRYFRRPIAASEVCWTYAGVRPLLEDEAASATQVTRDYRLELTHSSAHPPVLSIFGGKITTYRRLAQAVLEKLRPHLRGRMNQQEANWTERAALPGGDLPRMDLQSFVREVRRRWPFLGEELSLRLACAYGTRIERILGSARTMSELGTDCGGGLTQAELAYLRSSEWALHPEDVLWRRTKLGLHLSARERERASAEIAQALRS